MRGGDVVVAEVRLRLRRATDLRRAAELAAAGRVREARALVARHPDGRPVAAIEVNNLTDETPAAQRSRRTP